MKIINQITAPDSGEVFLDGERLQRKHISRIGYLPEERGLYKNEGWRTVIIFSPIKGLSKKDASKKLKYWFNKLDILKWWNKKVEELSKGMLPENTIYSNSNS